MIVFATTRAHRYTVARYLESPYAPPLNIDVTSYEALERATSIPVATWIFTDVDRLGPTGREIAASLYDSVAAHPGTRVLNDARRVLRRVELLEALKRAGINRHVAHRLEDTGEGMAIPAEGIRYPVFLREGSEHDGSITELLHDRAEAQAALRKLIADGHRPELLIAVEFEDVTGPDGLRRRWSAFVIEGDVIARSVLVSEHWVVKAPVSTFSDDTSRRETAFVEENPHADELRRIAELARIDYGRIDYSATPDGLRVWEINTNPTVGVDSEDPQVAARERFRRPARQAFSRRFNARLAEIDSPEAPGAEIPVSIDPELRRRAALERRARFAASLGPMLVETRRRLAAEG